MGKPRDDAERDRDRLRITPLYLKGWNQSEIATELGIDQSTVSRDIKFLKTEWAKQRNGIVDEFEGKYRFIYRQAIEAWERSLQDAVTELSEMIETPETITDAKGNKQQGTEQRLKASTRKEGQSGNPALLAQAQAALKAIREMFGVDVKNDPGSSEDKPFYMAQIKEIVVRRPPEGDTEAYDAVEDSE